MKYKDIPKIVSFTTMVEEKKNLDGKMYYRPLIQIPTYTEYDGWFGITYWKKDSNTWKSLTIEEPYRWVKLSRYLEEKWYDTKQECEKMIKYFSERNLFVEPVKNELYIGW